MDTKQPVTHTIRCSCHLGHQPVPPLPKFYIRNGRTVSTEGWVCVHCGKGRLRKGRCDGCWARAVEHAPVLRDDLDDTRAFDLRRQG
jgi:hypothetical protein